MTFQSVLALTISIIIAQAAGGAGAVFNVRSIPTWYRGLKKSRLNPPNWVFGPVWTTLFLLMAVAVWLVWGHRALIRANGGMVGVWEWAIALYIIQLVLNVLWSAIFFGLRKPSAAFFELVVLWLAILFTIINFRAIAPLAGWLMLPYILWVSFAGYLNFQVWRLNQQ